MHITCQLPILYFGTPVVIISTTNEDDTFNLAPISSVFWLKWRCVIGIAASSKTAENLLKTKECVLNLPSVHEVSGVNDLALTTGKNNFSEIKRQRGYRYEKDKFGITGFSPVASLLVNSPRVKECPVQMEAVVKAIHSIGADDDRIQGHLLNIELEILKVHVEENLLATGQTDKIDADKWKPLIMSFQHLYGLGNQLVPSKLAQIPEHLYK